MSWGRLGVSRGGPGTTVPGPSQGPRDNCSGGVPGRPGTPQDNLSRGGPGTTRPGRVPGQPRLLGGFKAPLLIGRGLRSPCLLGGFKGLPLEGFKASLTGRVGAFREQKSSGLG